MKGINIKYRVFWKFGTIFCAVLYFLGVYGVYLFFRRMVFKRYRTIVLTYHRVRDDNLDLDISVSTRNFREQVDFLKSGFKIVPLTEAINISEDNILQDKDRVAITFDDGYKDNYLNAYPVLKESNLPSCIFLISRGIGSNDDVLGIDEILEMKNGGVHFGGHTRCHKILSQIDTKIAEDEILGCKQDLEKLLSKRVDFFAYPNGKKCDFDGIVKNLVKAAGYKAAFTTENGTIDKSDLFELKRIGIRNCPLFVFKVRVSGLLESKGILFIRKLLRFM